jgi:hypothetical protein
VIITKEATTERYSRRTADRPKAGSLRIQGINLAHLRCTAVEVSIVVAAGCIRGRDDERTNPDLV